MISLLQNFFQLKCCGVTSPGGHMDYLSLDDGIVIDGQAAVGAMFWRSTPSTTFLKQVNFRVLVSISTIICSFTGPIT